MSFKTAVTLCALALIQPICAQFMGPYNSRAAAEVFGLGAPFADAAWATPYGIGPFAEATWTTPYGAGPCVEAAWATPYGMGPFGEAAWATPYGMGIFADTAWSPFGIGLGPADLAASNGAGLAVTSASPIAPTGVSIVSENAYEGALAIAGAIPFLGAVAIEGALPTIGGGAVDYVCGNCGIGILTEDIDRLPAPVFTYDGLVGPSGYDGIVGPACGRFGPYGYGGLYY